MGVLAVVGSGILGLRGVEGECGGGFGRREGVMQGGSGEGRGAGPVLSAGRTKVST